MDDFWEFWMSTQIKNFRLIFTINSTARAIEYVPRAAEHQNPDLKKLIGLSYKRYCVHVL